MLSEKEVVSVLRRDYSDWIHSLSEFERIAFRKYSYNSYDKKPNRFFERLNAMLRGSYNRSDKKKLEAYATAMSQAIKRFSLPHDIRCFRGTDIDPTIGMTIGTEFYLDQFVSTSVVASKILPNKTYTLVIYAPKGTKGAYIEEVSLFPKQREFLLNNDCRYKLIKRIGYVIELEVMT